MLIFKIIFGGKLAKIIVNKFEKNRKMWQNMTVQHRGILFYIVWICWLCHFNLRFTRKHTFSVNVIAWLNEINRSPMQIMSE